MSHMIKNNFHFEVMLRYVDLFMYFTNNIKHDSKEIELISYTILTLALDAYNEDIER